MDNSGGKRMGNRVEAGGAGVPPATIPASENLPKIHLFSTISHPAARHLAAPNQGENARPKGRTASCHFSLFTCHCRGICRAQADGEREETGEEKLQECLECRRAGSDGWETGGMSTLKTKKTASRTGTLICDKSIHKQRAYHSSGIQQIHPFALQGMSKN